MLNNGVEAIETINGKKVLDFYLGEIEKDNIAFLKNKAWYKKDISNEILKLR